MNRANRWISPSGVFGTGQIGKSKRPVNPRGRRRFRPVVTGLEDRRLLTNDSPITLAAFNGGNGLGSVSPVEDGQGNVDGSTEYGGAINQVVNQDGTTTTVTAAPDPRYAGQPVTLTATVAAGAPGGGTPTGTVAFFDGATDLGTVTLDDTGTATLPNLSLAVGAHSITATYSGDTDFTTSTSAATTEQVNLIGTTVALVSSANPAEPNQLVTFTATVTPDVDDDGIPTGSVVFADNVGGSGTAPLIDGVASLTASFPLGTYLITATYVPTGDFAGSTSPVLDQEVLVGTSVALVSSANPAEPNQPVTFTATVTPDVDDDGIPTGSVEFTDNVGGSGTATLIDGVASLTASFPLGTYLITATYVPTGDFAGSTSPVLDQEVLVGTTVALVASANPPVPNQPETFTATVTPDVDDDGIPTGSVDFQDNVGGSGTATLIDGVASLTASLPIGAYLVTATYIPTGEFAGSASAPLTLIMPAFVSVDAGQVVRAVDDQLLGVNLVDFDTYQNTPQTEQMVQAAGLTSFRFPGGAFSDDYHFNDPPSFNPDGNVANFATFIQTVGGTGIATLDYGSGSPQEAAAFLAYLDAPVGNTTPIGLGEEWSDSLSIWQRFDWRTADYWSSLRASAPLAVDDGLNFLRISHPAPFDIHYWEVGNEEYGDPEVDHHGQGGDPGLPHDPATYVNFANQFAGFAAEIAPGISIGLDVVPAPYSDNWTASVLQQSALQGFTPGFLSDHNYVQSPGNEDDATLLLDTVSDPANDNLYDWANRAASYEAELTQYLGAAGANVELLATEFNSVGFDPGKQTTSLVNGLFLADSLGSLLETPYDGADVYALRNGYDPRYNNSPSLYGWRQAGDYGIIGYRNAPPPDTGPYVPYPTYFAEQLASKLIVNGGTVITASSDDPDLSAYAVIEPDGDLDLLVINKTPVGAINGQFQVAGFTPSGQAQVWQYGETQDTAQSQSLDGESALANFTTTFAVSDSSFSDWFPAYSMTVLDLTAAPALESVATAVVDGQPASLTAAASGDRKPTVPGMVRIAGGTGLNPIPGASGDTLAFNARSSRNADRYEAVFTDIAGVAKTLPVAPTVKAITVTSLTESTRTPVFGQPVTFTATVSDVSTPTAPPTGGSVTFFDGTEAIGSAALSAGIASTLAAGAAHKVTAVYHGTGRFAPSPASNADGPVVRPAATSTVPASTSTSTTDGQSITSTAAVFDTSTTTAPANTLVVFYLDYIQGRRRRRSPAGP